MRHLSSVPVSHPALCPNANLWSHYDTAFEMIVVINGVIAIWCILTTVHLYFFLCSIQFVMYSKRCVTEIEIEEVRRGCPPAKLDIFFNLKVLDGIWLHCKCENMHFH